MSIEIIYTRLFNIFLRHSYYADGIARGVDLVPLPETKSILEGSRILSKALPGSVIASYRAESDGTTPLISAGPEVTFHFGIKVQNLSELVKISDLGNYQSGNFLVFDNNPANATNDPDNPEVLNMTLMDSVRPKRFTFSAQLNPAPASVDLELRDEQNNLVSAGKDALGNPLPLSIAVSPDANGIYSQQIDLLGKPDGIYTLRLMEGAVERLSKTIYFSDVLTGSPFVGIARIHYVSAPAHLYGNTEQYALQFNRKGTLWQYFIVHKSGTADLIAHTFTIDDVGGASTPYPAVNFNQQGSIPHGTIAINGLDTAVFRSIQVMPFFEQPKLQLHLREVNGAFNKVLVEHLPNPTPTSAQDEDGGNTLSNIIVFV